LHQIQYAVKQGCIRLRNALERISEAIFAAMESRVADCKAAEAALMAFVADCWGKADSPDSRPQAQAQCM